MFTFFSATVKPSLRLLPDCSTCRAYEACQHAKQAASPITRNTVIIVDGIPEDVPNGARVPKRYKMLLKRAGVSYWPDAVLPASACPGADRESWKHCTPLLIESIKKKNPEKIIIAGYQALQSVIGHLWGEPCGEPTRWAGQVIPSRELNAWVFPIEYINQFSNKEVAALWAYRWSQAARNSTGRPYSVPPDYEKMFTVVYDHRELERFWVDIQSAKWTAFDIETTGRKPEGDCHSIYSAAITYLREDGSTHCVSFLVTDETEGFLKRYLQSPVRKIGANNKFEIRWCRVKLGTEIRNFVWDTVVSAHIDDARKGVAGVKFQAFAKLGLRHYAHGIEPYFEGDTNSTTNSIYSADSGMVLRYNAIDSLAELDLGILQMREAGFTEIRTNNLPKDRENG